MASGTAAAESAMIAGECSPRGHYSDGRQRDDSRSNILGKTIHGPRSHFYFFRVFLPHNLRLAVISSVKRAPMLRQRSLGTIAAMVPATPGLGEAGSLGDSA